MAIDLLVDRGTPLDQQRFTWKDLVQPPYSKLDDDAFTRVRVIIMNGIESEALRFSHACARMNRDLQLDLARIRRIEQHQQTLVNWLSPPDQNVLETIIGFERVAIGSPPPWRWPSPTSTWRASIASACSKISTTCTATPR